jgi:hypothetical protein
MGGKTFLAIQQKFSPPTWNGTWRVSFIKGTKDPNLNSNAFTWPLNMHYSYLSTVEKTFSSLRFGLHR